MAAVVGYHQVSSDYIIQISLRKKEISEEDISETFKNWKYYIRTEICYIGSAKRLLRPLLRQTFRQLIVSVIMLQNALVIVSFLSRDL